MNLVATLQRDLKESKHEINSIKISHAKCQKEHSQSCSSYERDPSHSPTGVTAPTTTSAAEVRRLQERIHVLDRELHQAETLVQETQEQMAAAHRQSDSVRLEESDRREADYQRLLKRVRDQDAEFDQMRQVNVEREAELETLRANLVAVQTSAADSLKREKTAVDEMRTKCKVEIDKLEDQLRQAKANEQRYEHMHRDLRADKRALKQLEANVQFLREQLTQKDAELVQTQDLLAARSEQLEKLEMRVLQSEFVRRRLHDKVMELKGNIRVFCRVRPVLRNEGASSGVFEFPDASGGRRQIELLAAPTSHQGYGQRAKANKPMKYAFEFDLVLNGASSQEDVFLEVSALVQSAMDGYNVCIFAYGQTG